MARRNQLACLDCQSVDRRGFFGSVGAAALAGGALSLAPRGVHAAPSRTSAAETAVKRLHASLTGEQRKEVVLGWDDKRRQTLSANWQITKASVGSFSADQQKIIDEIVRGVTSADGYERLQRQMKDDSGGRGVTAYSVAIFGDPEKDRFEFELAGHHLTLRCDGDTVPGAVFGGPLVYGHGAKGNSTRNLFFYQTKRANELYAALDEKHRKQALLARAPGERSVELRKEGEALPGISGSDLSKDQLELFQKVVTDILAPYRKEDVDEVQECIKAGGGYEKLHIAFYQTGDLDDDGVWDVWRVEGPTFCSHFRGAPHVHAYLNVARRV